MSLEIANILAENWGGILIFSLIIFAISFTPNRGSSLGERERGDGPID